MMNDGGDVIRQRSWTEAELQAAGYRYYVRQKQLVMARVLPEEEAPKQISASWATLYAQAGDVICYRPEGDAARSSIDAFEHWPVQHEIFEQDYVAWDTPPLPDTPALRQLRAAGCQPYYKRAGCWARRLTSPAWVQSLESPEPVRYPAGAWVCIGSNGEPWAQPDDSFRLRYVVDD